MIFEFKYFGACQMKFLDKLDVLMSEKGLNKRTLSIESGVPYTTILSFWDKGCDNIKLSTLRTLAKYFNVTLDYLADDSVDITVSDAADEQALLRLYQQADPKIRRAIDSLLKGE
jgi:DNA-binding Xre family transcriptional regulator